MRVLSCLRVSISPPPPGRGMCERAIDLRRRAGWRFACFLSYRIALSLGARSLSSCLRLGSSSSRASFFLLAWSGLDALSPGPVLASPRVPRPMRFLLRPCFRPVSSVGFGRLVAPCLIVLASAIAWGRVIPSVRSLASLRRCRLSASCPPLRLVLSLLGSSRASSRSPVSSGQGDRCRIVWGAACLLARVCVCVDSVLLAIVRLYRSVMLYI